MVSFCRCVWGSKLSLFLDPEIHHLPDPGTVNGAIDLFSLCYLVIFGNALDFRTYCTPDGGPVKGADKNDVNNISVDERYNMCVARGTCLELLRWWNSNYSISTTEFSCKGQFTTSFLVFHGLALFLYKFRTEQDGRLGAPGCTKDLLYPQIINVINHLGVDDKVSLVREFSNTGRFQEDVKFGLSRESLDMMTVTCLNLPQLPQNHNGN